MTIWAADAHCDTAWRMAAHPELDFFSAGGDLDLNLPRLEAGNVRLQVMACFCGSKGVGEEARVTAMAALDACDELEARGLRFLTRLPMAPPEGISLLRGIEGGEALRGDMGAMEAAHARGVRLLTLTWNHPNEIGNGAVSGEESGLTAFGRAVVRRMNALRMIIDVSHLNERGFYDVLDASDAPFIASHSCVKPLCDHPRNLTDAQIDALICRDGFVGINFYPAFLRGDTATVADIARHIDAIVQRGGARNVGLGSDFDGIETKPEGMTGPQDLSNLYAHLRGFGYSEDAIQAIAGGNLWRIFREILGGGLE